MKFRALILSILLAASFSSTSSASEPGWWGVIIANGEDRARIKASLIIDRPYRPLHFYGNTIRRRHFRGETLARPKDFLYGAFAWMFRRRLNL